MSYFDEDRIKQFFFILIILLIGGVLFWKLSVFIPAFLGALTLYVIMRPANFYLINKRGWKPWITALILILLSVIILLVPMGLVINMMTKKISVALAHSSEIIDAIRQVIEKIKFSTNVDLLSKESVQKTQEVLTKLLPQLLGSTFNVLTTIVIMYFLLYFMLTEADRMEEVLYKNLPLKKMNKDRLGEELKAMVISNAVGLPLIAVVQGGFCILGYWIFGVQDYIFWGVITGIMGMIPVVGTAIAWVPLVIYQMATGEIGMGIGLAIYCLAVVGSVDNIFRFIWQKEFADVHPLITIFGVLIGVSLFGFVGLIFGPLLLSLFILLLLIYRDEFGNSSQSIKVFKKKKKRQD